MNNIIIELCAEDRARLDRLAAAMEKATANSVTTAKTPTATTEPPQKDEIPEPVEIVTPKPEKVAEPEPVPEIPAEDDLPSPNLADIQSKVMQLATANGGAKKAQVRAIISAYGAKVSDLKDKPSVWPEVWDKLTALEG